MPKHQRGRNTQAAAQVAGGQDRLPRDIDFGADPSGVVAECDAGLSQRGAAGCPRKKLDAQFSFQPEQSPTDDRLRDAEPASGRRYSAGVSHFDKCPQVFEYPFPRSAFRDTARQIARLPHPIWNDTMNP